MLEWFIVALDSNLILAAGIDNLDHYIPRLIDSVIRCYLLSLCSPWIYIPNTFGLYGQVVSVAKLLCS